MSIAKRFFVFISGEIIITLIAAILIVSWMTKESPAVLEAQESAEAEIVSQFTALGYEEGYTGLIRYDPLDNMDSRVDISFYNYGALERIRCESAYINTQSANSIYSDMEAVIKIMGGSLESDKEEVMKAIGKMIDGQSARTDGKLNHISWEIESSTFDDKQGGKLRYICFSAQAAYDDK